MARRLLGPASLEVVQAVRPWLFDGGLTRVGVSGGTDSMALAAAVAHLTREGWPRAEAVVVDHGLQAGSDAVAAQVVERVSRLGLECRSVRVEVTETGDGPEAAARTARYRALTEPKADRLLVAHTMDDQAETVLLGLARGSGTRSLAGMARVQGILARPLLGIRRATAERACQEWGLEVWHDPTNSDLRFLRARVRHVVLPTTVDQLGPGVIEALARTAGLAGQDADFLDAWSHSVADLVVGVTLRVAEIERLDPAIRSRVVRSWLASQGVGQIDHERTEAVLALILDWRGQRGIDLPGHRRVRRVAGQLVVDRV